MHIQGGFFMKDIMLLTGAGQIGLAMARRMGSGKTIVPTANTILPEGKFPAE